MMKPMNLAPRRLVFATAGALLCAGAIAVSGCGDDVPPNAVATVDGTPIKKAEFNHWLKAAAGSQAQPGGGAAAVPDAPKFTKCIATKRAAQAPQGASKPTAKQAKEQCQQEYDGLKDQVMQFLISSQWIQKEANAQGVEASQGEIQKSFEEQKKQSFPKDEDYKKFLQTSGQTEADLKFRVKLDVLTNEIRKKITEDEGKVTDDDIKEYYDKNKKQFGTPESRDLLVVLTENKADADKAKQALEDGQDFNDVAKRYSIDDASKQQGGKLAGVTKGQQEKALDEAVFKAKKGVVVGPVKTQFGYYVFEVEKVKPATQQPLAKAKDSIRNLLKSQGEQKALDDFVKDFQKKYKDETKCAKGFVIEDCDNAPKPKDQPASGGAPQGGPAPGGPQAPGGATPQGVPPGGAPVPVPQGGAPQGVPPGGAPQGGAPVPVPQGGAPQGGAPQQVPVQP